MASRAAPEVLERQRRFLESIRDAGRAAVEAGRPLSAVVLERPGMPAYAVAPLPAEVADWAAPVHAAMLRAAYLEAQSGKPYGAYFDKTKP
ncbi:MAG: hypothetical protein R2724_05945 [Bryobacterales bacterium]